MKTNVRRVVVGAAVSLALFVVLDAEGTAESAGGGTITGTVTAMPHKYLRDTVVHLVSVRGQWAPKTVDMDQRQLHFVPHVLAITMGDTVRFLNHDTVSHNVFSPEGHYDLGTWPPGETRSHTFTQIGAYSQLCNMHQNMLAWVYVNQNPYQAVPDASGHFTIADVPPGTYVLAVWSSKLHAPDVQTTVAAGRTTTVSVSLQR
jgi:plastocyanin